MSVYRFYFTLLFCTILFSATALARDVGYDNNSPEIDVFVGPGEPTQVKFPGKVTGGYKRKDSTISLDRNGRDLIIFAHKNISGEGEGFIVRLEDGRSYSVRAKKATDQSPRDDFVNIYDNRGDIILSKEEEEPAYKEKNFEYAPATKVSGLMREMMLVGEFGKNGVVGYQKSDKYRGEVVLDDGAILATIDTIFIGPNLWGYVLNAQNRLDQTMRINPATFRLDGTRAISATNWELSAKPINVEQQISGKDQSKIYIITRAKR